MNDDRTLLPEQIRNLPDGVQPEGDGDAFCRGFRFGHRAACHAAAELAAAALSSAPAQEPVGWRETMQQALDALEMAHAGLEWYRDAQPGNVNGSDEEADEVIGDAMQALRDALSASPLPQEVKALTDERINELAAEYGDKLDQAFIFNRLGRFSAVAFGRAIERELRWAQEGKAGECGKSLNALAADLLRPYLKPGQKVIWRESFRWHDDNGVLPNHYDGMELPALAEDFGYDWEYAFDFKHAAIVWKMDAAPVAPPSATLSASSKGEQ